jgi:hypothetical protein
MNRIPATQARLQSLLLALTFAFCVLAPASALAIPRTTVLTRAHTWVKKPVKYSQSKYHLGYRTDCSGYVSMCWDTKRSWSTATFYRVTHRITRGELRPGDAMLKPGYHVRLFHHWLNSSHTRYATYESGYGKVAVLRKHSLWTDLHAGYTPTRYNEILESRPADDVLWNGSFDAWSGLWGSGDKPVVWSVAGSKVAGSEESTLAVHRFNTAHTGLNSLQLRASANDSDTPTEISQTAPVTVGAVYQARAWVRASGDPNALRMSVEFFGADDVSIAETGTRGVQSGIKALGFSPVTVLATAPAGAVNAVVTVALASPVASATVPSSAIIDDVSLVRLRSAVSIKASAGTVRRGKKITLSGAVWPNNAVGVTATVYMQAPGRGWKRLAGAQVTATASGAAWRSSYTPKLGVRRGAYRFRTVVPAFPGYLGRTSRTVSVRVK